MITIDEFLSELGKIQSVQLEGTFTTDEFRQKIGCSRCTAQRTIKDYINLGKLEYAGSRPEPTVTGSMKPVPVYRVVA